MVQSNHFRSRLLKKLPSPLLRSELRLLPLMVPQTQERDTKDRRYFPQDLVAEPAMAPPQVNDCCPWCCPHHVFHHTVLHSLSFVCKMMCVTLLGCLDHNIVKPCF